MVEYDNTTQEYSESYAGVEPVEIGNLEDIKEERTVIPATKRVKFRIVKAENRTNEDNTYRSVNLQLRIVDGIDEEGKYKGKMLFSRVCYYADPNAYTKEFFKKKQHLIQFKYLLKAVGLENVQKFDGKVLEQLENQEVYGDIVVRPRPIIHENTGEEEIILVNEVRYFKSIPVNEMI